MKKYTKEKYKNKEDWLKSRGLGGTSASAITGSSQWKDKIELFNSIIIPNNKSVETYSQALTYGTECEPLIRKQFALDFQDKYRVVAPKAFELYRRLDKPYMTATPDSILFDLITGEKGIQEIKTHDIKNRADEEEWTNRIPQNYFEQVIWYMAVLNDVKFVEVTAKLRFYDYFDPDGKKLLKTETRYYHIDRQDVNDSITNLEKIATRFWEENVIKGQIPKVFINFGGE